MKRVFLFFAALLIVSCVAIPAFAEEPTVEASTAAPAETLVTTTEAAVTTAVVTAPVEETTASLVDEVAAALSDFFPELLSGATLLGIGALGLLAKKKLIPAITDALSTLFKFTKDNSEKNAADIAMVKGKVNELFTRFEGIATIVEASQKNLCAEVELIAETSCDLSESIVELLNNTDIPADAKAKIAAAHEKHLAAMNAVREVVKKNEE